MGLLQQIQRFLSKKEPTTETSIAPRNEGINGYPWQMSDSRKDTWMDIMDMDATYPIVSRGVDILTNFSILPANSASPEITVRGDAKAKEVIEELFKRIEINNIAQDIIRNMILSGDLFSEIVINDEWEIIRLKPIRKSYAIMMNTDIYGNLLHGNPEEAIPNGGVSAYEQMDDDLINVVAAFWPYQIVHFQCGSIDPETLYTQPILYPCIAIWKRHIAKLDSIALQRLTKAFSVYVHKIPVPIQATPQERERIINKYIDNIKKDTIATYDTTSARFTLSTREKPTQVNSEMYVERRYTPDGKIVDSEVDAIDTSSSAISELADIELDVKFIMSTIMVPLHYYPMQIGTRTFVDKSSDKAEESFAYMVKNIQSAFIDGLKKVCNLQLLFSGIDPDSVYYEIALPQVRPTSTETAAATDKLRAETATILTQLGIPEEVIGLKYLGLSPEETEQWIQQKNLLASQTTPNDESGGGNTKQTQGSQYKFQSK